MPSTDGVQVTGVICVVVRDEVCRCVCGVGLVLGVVLLRHGWNTNQPQSHNKPTGSKYFGNVSDPEYLGITFMNNKG
jgi:hypothetical protein